MSTHQAQNDAARHFQAARQLHQQGRLEEAEREYRAVLAAFPDHPGTLQGIGAICFQSGRLEETAQMLARAAAAVDDVTLLNNLGHVLHMLGRDAQALPYLEKSVTLDGARAQTHTNLGNVLAALQRPEDALASFSKAVALDPKLPEPHNNIGTLYSTLGHHDAAIAAFEAALTRKSDFTAARNNLGSALTRQGRHEEALIHFEDTLALQPDFLPARYNLATTLATLRRHDEAIGHFEKVVAQRRHAAAFNNMGNSLNALGRCEAALEAFAQAIAMDPVLAAPHFGRGSALQHLGRLEEARAAYAEALALEPSLPTYHRAAAESRTIAPGDPQIAILEALAREEEKFPLHERIELHFALAKIHADLAQQDLAFDHLETGNRLKRVTIAYDESATLGAMARLAAAFTKETMVAMQGAGVASALPVFILGMPRSGTSLVEQLLASHPQMFGAGERTEFGDIFAGGYAPAHLLAAAAPLSREKLHQTGETYLARMRALAPEAARIIDKLPSNFLYAGAIHLALPGARFIHVKRDPADTCFSCYSKLFTGTLDQTYDLGELGRYYKAYETLMDHWRGVLPPGAMQEVSYENLVTDFEAEARRIIAFAGLQWDARVLAFHETERSVRTASAFQVRQPLFRDGIGRWRIHEARLSALLEALGTASAS